QPPTSLGLEVRPQILSEEKNNNPLRIIGLNYRRKGSDEGKLHIFQLKRSTRMPLYKRIYNKDQQ
ncbi:4003_t:CDS:2, partial [Funneliformis geosporum]